MKIGTTLGALAIAASLACRGAQAHTAADLRLLTESGRYLHDYDQASRLGTDAVLTIAKGSPIGRGIAFRSPSGWTVDFGKITSDGSAFAVSYEAVQSLDDPRRYAAEKFSQPQLHIGSQLALATGYFAAQRLVAGGGRPFGMMLAYVSSNDLSFYVYVYPAMVGDLSYPYGGDERFHYSADGRVLLGQMRLHDAKVDVPVDHALRGVHLISVRTDISDMPVETDVFYALSYKLAQEIVARGHRYRVDPNGTIRDEGPAPTASPVP